MKNTAAIQSWHRRESSHSKCQFVMSYRSLPNYFYRDSPDVPCEETGFLCDLFALCHHPVTDFGAADHSDPGQWQVYLVPVDPRLHGVTESETARLRDKFGSRKRATLIRTPESIAKGIRHRKPIPPIPATELSLTHIYDALELDRL